jgi:hypothetical protein
MSDWISWYSRSSPYSCKKHELTSYRLTYSQLFDLLRYYDVATNQVIVDFGAGSGLQFREVVNLREWEWILIEPAKSIHHEELSQKPFILELRRNFDDVYTTERVTCMVICSVSQYLHENQLFENLDIALMKFPDLKTIIITDVQTKTNKLHDAMVYFYNAIKFGWLVPAVFKIINLLLGEYSTIKEQNPLRTFSIDEFSQYASTRQLQLKIAKENIGYNFHRKTIVLQKFES